MATIPKKSIERFQQELGRFQKILQAAKDRDVNESDTVVIVTDILNCVFGFDKYAEITSEFAIRSTYCDLAIKISGSVKYLIEVKSIGVDLKEAHLRQAADYGANHGVDWVVITNGIDWEVYKIIFQKPVSQEKVTEFNLLEMSARKEEDQRKLFLLCKEGISRAAIEEFHHHRQAINRFVIGALLLSDPCMTALRRELKRVAPGIHIDNKEIEHVLRTEVLKREVIECDSAVQARAAVKRAIAKAVKLSSGAGQQGDTQPVEAKPHGDGVDATHPAQTQ